MRSLQRATGSDTAAKHARFLSSVSRHMLSLDLDPMLEAVAHAALPLLGDACAVDRFWGGPPTRLLEVRIRPDVRIGPTAEFHVRSPGRNQNRTWPLPDDRPHRRRRRAFRCDHLRGAKGRRAWPRRDGPHPGARRAARARDSKYPYPRPAARIRGGTRAADLRGRSRAARPHLLARAFVFRRSVAPTVNDASERKPGSATRLMDIIDREERRLARLIDDLLDMARVRSGQLVLDLEYVDLCGVLQDVTTRMSMEAERAGCTLQVDAADSLVGHWDRARLDQVITNLVGNAIKFGERRPITISAVSSPDGSLARLSVTDHGVGIAPEQQQQIFEPFKRAAGPNRYKGLGPGALHRPQHRQPTRREPGREERAGTGGDVHRRAAPLPPNRACAPPGRSRRVARLRRCRPREKENGPRRTEARHGPKVNAQRSAVSAGPVRTGSRPDRPRPTD